MVTLKAVICCGELVLVAIYTLAAIYTNEYMRILMSESVFPETRG